MLEVLPKTVKLQQAPPPKPQSDYNISSFSSYRKSSSSSPAFYNYSHKKEDEESDSVLNTDNPQKQELLNKSFQLSSSQKAALEAIMQRKSVFYTGAAGTGKSFILSVLLDALEVLGLSEKVAATAPTGVAACNVRGLTLHS